MAWLKSYLSGFLNKPANVPIMSDPVDDFNALTLARVDLSGKTADVSSTALWTDLGQGSTDYSVSGYTTITTVASTGSATSTLPPVVIGFTDAESNTVTSIKLGATNTANVLGTVVQGVGMIHAKAGTAITFTTSGYASNTAAQMTFSAHVFIERL